MIKVYYNDEDELVKIFCELMQCSGEQPTESDPTGCTGCDALEEWFDEKYSEHIIDETNYKEFISKDELFEWINKELSFSNSQKKEFNKGYFHALEKLKSLIITPSLDLKKDIQPKAKGDKK